MRSLWDYFTGCSHRNTSRVFTLRRRPKGAKETYTVCLDCGAKRLYDWRLMRYETEAETKRRERTAEAV